MKNSARSQPFPQRLKAARFLAKCDPRLARVIAAVGPVQIRLDPDRTLFDALLSSIVYQQLHGKAAATILGRVQAHFGNPGGPVDPRALLQATDETLRTLGLSRNKMLSIQDLARRTIAGTLPDLKSAHAMNDEALIDALSEVRGIGEWTAQIFLIFTLGRGDVLPVLDFGIKKGFGVVYGKKKFPTAAELEKYARRWRPYRSVACWYLWRALELEEFKDACRKILVK